MTTRSESDVERYLVSSCRQRGLLALKFVSPGRAGVPDRLLVTPAGVFFAEIKAPGKKPRKIQRLVQDKIRNAGGEVFVLDSRQDVDTLLDALVGHPAAQENTRNQPRQHRSAS